ncbi:TasA family protein [Mesobacillus selenatarsenatis]|uniref:Stationary phase secreted protein TasA, major protein component of biofilm matrix n=1 Tax=Mesobacillus selenatarsenatis (strain DSM 18680 / JCM 14380 / FERM P-15431 / SF-1) TaxID=1321606 RepID=A0A0A8X6B9_MESS1|nr:TasA family protein [Mesobacillus selenatarsenatis]GAM15443.1 stationary phase secreted protein TasA, major protein component of biofilm matrix [Mesobacillus selenatarsenatis SF-1]
MSLKKKITMGALSATLGLSLVAGGTWAAFNDVETVSAGMEAGTLKLDLKKYENKPFNFQISDLKPGDKMTRNIKLVNSGTLAIRDVLMSIESVQFADYVPAEGEAGYEDDDTWGDNNVVQYLNQFRVTVMQVGAEGGSGGFPRELIPADKDVRLGDFYLASGSLAGDDSKLNDGVTQADINTALSNVWGAVDHTYIDAASRRINGATINPNEWTGLPVNPNDDDVVEISIEFVKDNTLNDKGTYVQNKYQGDTATVNFQFEARQWGGQEVTDSDIGAGLKGADKEGYIQTNERANNGN